MKGRKAQTLRSSSGKVGQLSSHSHRSCPVSGGHHSPEASIRDPLPSLVLTFKKKKPQGRARMGGYGNSLRSKSRKSLSFGESLFICVSSVSSVWWDPVNHSGLL